MKKINSFPIEWIKILQDIETERKFIVDCQDLGFQINRSFGFIDKKFWSLKHKTIVGLSIGLTIKDNKILTISEKWSWIEFDDKPCEFNEFVSKIKQYIRDKLQIMLNDLDKSTYIFEPIRLDYN